MKLNIQLGKTLSALVAVTKEKLVYIGLFPV